MFVALIVTQLDSRWHVYIWAAYSKTIRKKERKFSPLLWVSEKTFVCLLFLSTLGNSTKFSRISVDIIKKRRCFFGKVIDRKSLTTFCLILSFRGAFINNLFWRYVSALVRLAGALVQWMCPDTCRYDLQTHGKRKWSLRLFFYSWTFCLYQKHFMSKVNITSSSNSTGTCIRAWLLCIKRE